LESKKRKVWAFFRIFSTRGWILSMNGKKVKYWRFDNEIKNRERNKKLSS